MRFVYFLFLSIITFNSRWLETAISGDVVITGDVTTAIGDVARNDYGAALAFVEVSAFSECFLLFFLFVTIFDCRWLETAISGEIVKLQPLEISPGTITEQLRPLWRCLRSLKASCLYICYYFWATGG